MGSLRKCAGLTALALGLVACSKPAVQRVAVIVLDATHDVHLSSYGGPTGLTPVIDTLAARGRRYEFAVSNANWTLPSTASLLSGRSQESHGLVRRERRLAPDIATLPQLFQAAGFETAAFSQMAFFSPDFGLDRGFDAFNYYVLDPANPAQNTVPDLVDWVSRRPDSSWFVVCHLRRPHSPYNAAPEWRVRLDPDGPLADGRRDAELAHADTFKERQLGKAALDRVEVLYRANLAQQDEELDQLLRILESQDVLVVLTSDHGEALGRRGVFGHGMHTAWDNVDIPLIVAGPGVRPGLDRSPVQTIDLAPTLIELFGLETPPGLELEGASYASTLRGDVLARSAPLYSSDKFGKGGVDEVAVFEGPHKLILDAQGHARLFDRFADPAELEDLAEGLPAVVTGLRALAEARLAAAAEQAARPDGDTTVSAEMAEQLELLGYGESSED